MVTYEDLRTRGLIKRLETTEKEQYVSFHRDNYKIDLTSANNFLKHHNSKYTVIAGYYAVLNVTLWHLAKEYNLKISEKEVGVHTNCQIALQEYIKDRKRKEKILKLLAQAKQEFSAFTTLKRKPEETLPTILKHSSEKRKRYTYYSSERTLPRTQEQLREAKQFLEQVVTAYITIMERL